MTLTHDYNISDYSHIHVTAFDIRVGSISKPGTLCKFGLSVSGTFIYIGIILPKTLDKRHYGNYNVIRTFLARIRI